MPENPPVNVTAVLNGTEVLMTWEGPPGKLNGELQGYVVEYSTASAQQVSLGFIIASELFFYKYKEKLHIFILMS